MSKSVCHFWTCAQHGDLRGHSEEANRGECGVLSTEFIAMIIKFPLQ